MKRILVVGGDGYIGSHIIESKHLRSPEFIVSGTSRRPISNKKIYLDISSGNFQSINHFKPDVLILSAGMTGFKQCKLNIEASYQVNVLDTLKLIEYAIDKNIFIVYLSTSAVFDGKKDLCQEYDKKTPSTIYGQHKSVAEDLILSLDKSANRVAIIRVTKVLNLLNGLIPNFLKQINSKKIVRVSNNINISPVSMDYLEIAIYRIIKFQSPGIFHLSSNDSLSYMEFMNKICEEKGLSSKLIIGEYLSKGEDMLYFPKYSRLGMELTHKKIGLNPLKIESLIDMICNTIK